MQQSVCIKWLMYINDNDGIRLRYYIATAAPYETSQGVGQGAIFRRSTLNTCLSLYYIIHVKLCVQTGCRVIKGRWKEKGIQQLLL